MYEWEKNRLNYLSSSLPYSHTHAQTHTHTHTHIHTRLQLQPEKNVMWKSTKLRLAVLGNVLSNQVNRFAHKKNVHSFLFWKFAKRRIHRLPCLVTARTIKTIQWIFLKSSLKSICEVGIDESLSDIVESRRTSHPDPTSLPCDCSTWPKFRGYHCCPDHNPSNLSEKSD